VGVMARYIYRTCPHSGWTDYRVLTSGSGNLGVYFRIFSTTKALSLRKKDWESLGEECTLSQWKLWSSWFIHTTTDVCCTLENFMAEGLTLFNWGVGIASWPLFPVQLVWDDGPDFWTPSDSYLPWQWPHTHRLGSGGHTHLGSVAW
jgi:hypothetical protein